ncbi:MAG: hypothetical protein KatS3mg061_0951 [Dehalococcoidia bacterium]|nr:MAG: hypothetical protein KatS3mg061_0951 [Dehalococcoidia bacterium]
MGWVPDSLSNSLPFTVTHAHADARSKAHARAEWWWRRAAAAHLPPPAVRLSGGPAAGRARGVPLPAGRTQRRPVRGTSVGEHPGGQVLRTERPQHRCLDPRADTPRDAGGWGTSRPTGGPTRSGWTSGEHVPAWRWPVERPLAWLSERRAVHGRDDTPGIPAPRPAYPHLRSALVPCHCYPSVASAGVRTGWRPPLRRADGDGTGPAAPRRAVEWGTAYRGCSARPGQRRSGRAASSRYRSR